MPRPPHAAADQRLEIGFLEGLDRRCPRDPDILKALGDLYTRVGRIEDGLRVDLELTRLCPREPLVWYNLACSYARLEAPDNAFAALDQAVARGYRDAAFLRADRDLASLRTDRRFAALLQRLGA